MTIVRVGGWHLDQMCAKLLRSENVSHSTRGKEVMWRKGQMGVCNDPLKFSIWQAFDCVQNCTSKHKNVVQQSKLCWYGMEKRDGTLCRPSHGIIIMIIIILSRKRIPSRHPHRFPLQGVCFSPTFHAVLIGLYNNNLWKYTLYVVLIDECQISSINTTYTGEFEYFHIRLHPWCI